MEFQSLQLNPQLISSVSKAGYTVPTPIQAQSIPHILKGRDLLGIAQTGTGKTAAFALPILHNLAEGARGKLRALVLAPTRELAHQIHESFCALGGKTRLRSFTVYGGVGLNPQIENFRKGLEIAVACPGRLLDHIERGSADLSAVDVVVLDEADRMFDMGFLPDVRKILKKLPAGRQTLLFSATMPEEVRHLADEMLRNPETVKVAEKVMADTVSHTLYPVKQNEKTSLLISLLGSTSAESVLVFTRTKHRASKVAEKLAKEGHKATALQGNLSQNRRQAALSGFKNGTYRILVATDIAARGIDVATISHVINFDMPNTLEDYTHRTGRTGRACRSGDAFSLVTSEDRSLVRAIERNLSDRIEWATTHGMALTDTEAETFRRDPATDDGRRSPKHRQPTNNVGRKQFRRPKKRSSAHQPSA